MEWIGLEWIGLEWIGLEWIGWAIVLAQIAVLGAVRYWLGKWPLKFDL